MFVIGVMGYILAKERPEAIAASVIASSPSKTIFFSIFEEATSLFIENIFPFSLEKLFEAKSNPSFIAL